MENSESKINKLKEALRLLYLEHKDNLLFHGWHHVDFVRKKAMEFARAIEANVFLVESAALVHDLNYIVETNSEPEMGKDLRSNYLSEAGYSAEEISQIENIVMEADIGNRTGTLSKEGMALSDADTLFKSLPTTPILFAGRYIDQNKIDIAKLADKICSEQKKLMEQGIYFYTDLAKQKYIKWAETNLALWSNVNEALKDEDVVEMLKNSWRLLK